MSNKLQYILYTTVSEGGFLVYKHNTAGPHMQSEGYTLPLDLMQLQLTFSTVKMVNNRPHLFTPLFHCLVILLAALPAAAITISSVRGI
jgi:hypothetical protein